MSLNTSVHPLPPVSSWQSGSASLLGNLSKVIWFLSAVVIAAHKVPPRGRLSPRVSAICCFREINKHHFRLGCLFSPQMCLYQTASGAVLKEIKLCLSHFQTFKRDGNDLFINHKIGLVEALCGCQFLIKHLDGRQIVVKYPAGKVIEPGQLSPVTPS